MTDQNKQKNNLRKHIDKIKTFGVSALLLASSLNVFGQKDYNNKCNGSLAWLSATTETRGSANPSGTISSGSTYHGINQLDGYNVSRLVNFINQNDAYKSLQGKLSVSKTKAYNKNGKLVDVYKVNDTQWKALAESQCELFTLAQEDFLCQVYLPECFERLQKSLIKDAKTQNKKPLMVSDIHPVVLSLFARSYVKGPYSSAPFNALKTAGDLKKINSEAFIIQYVGQNSYLQNKALSSFRDNTIQWKDAQLTAACSRAQKQVASYLSAEAKSTPNQENLTKNKQNSTPKTENKQIAQASPKATNVNPNTKLAFNTLINSNRGR